MTQLNPFLKTIPAGYLFEEVAHKVGKYRNSHPDQTIIDLGCGDISRPLVPAILEALQTAVEEMGQEETFRGYGPSQGYAFLRETIARYRYGVRNVNISPDEIFIGDGTKSDIGNFQELFAPTAFVAVTDPSYPVYVDSNSLCGRAGQLSDSKWNRIIYMPVNPGNQFIPDFPKQKPDVIYLCCPANPTGTVMSREVLKSWVDYALQQDCVILFDAAYEAFISEPDVPHSIYEIEGAENVAVEFRSFSKTAGFTGLRCSYVVIPSTLSVGDGMGCRIGLKNMWERRQNAKYNGCPYIVQRAAEAACLPKGRAQLLENIAIYRANALSLLEAVRKLGLNASGGTNSPYVWVEAPKGMNSQKFFDRLLQQTGIVCAPGSGFGPGGDGFARLSGFSTPEKTTEAVSRLTSLTL
ncbi:MAG: LL-diaminopimelate aminotransferase [Desulfovibrionaceae bacterium]|nr:LL-diaminopimelate aminotransferase [Desulfovibrionaceae bacterium]